MDGAQCSSRRELRDTRREAALGAQVARGVTLSSSRWEWVAGAGFLLVKPAIRKGLCFAKTQRLQTISLPARVPKFTHSWTHWMSNRIGEMISKRMQNSANKAQIWRAAIIVGVGLIVLGMGAGYVDEATDSEFHFISRNVGYFLLAVVLGVALSFVAIIGWAKQFVPKTQLRTAGVVFVAPLVAALVGYRIDGLSIHSTSGLLLLIILVALLLALVLVMMAGY